MRADFDEFPSTIGGEIGKAADALARAIPIAIANKKFNMASRLVTLCREVSEALNTQEHK